MFGTGFCNSKSRQKYISNPCLLCATLQAVLQTQVCL
jgi:hypothetical protein